jgi:hypothetical protein
MSCSGWKGPRSQRTDRQRAHLPHIDIGMIRAHDGLPRLAAPSHSERHVPGKISGAWLAANGRPFGRG